MNTPASMALFFSIGYVATEFIACRCKDRKQVLIYQKNQTVFSSREAHKYIFIKIYEKTSIHGKEPDDVAALKSPESASDNRI